MRLVRRGRQTTVDELAPVLEAWRLSPMQHKFLGPLDEDGLLAAEARLGRPLPTMLRRVYEFSNGLEAFGGCLTIEPALVASDLADELRDSEWPIPPELLMFGGDGSDNHWGIWYPASASPDGSTL
jgi:hypothetical protein